MPEVREMSRRSTQQAIADRENAAATATSRRRLPRGARVQRIVEEAARLFAERGFDASTRELAARLGVTQALLYRYFPSKEQLIERVFESSFQNFARRAVDPSLLDRSRPLEPRLIEFYQRRVAGISATSMRLFVRAGLDQQGLAGRVSVPLTETVLAPIVEELRHEVGLPDGTRRPLMRGERELAMTLHGALMFLAIRKHVYGMPMPDDLSDLVALQVRAFLPGARAELRRLHAAPDQPTLTVRQLDRRQR
jgi:AcrR family transcriptional regulator